MRGWMFLGTFAALRERLLRDHDLRTICDVDRGAFDEVPNEVLAAVIASLRREAPRDVLSVAAQPTPLSDKSYDRQRTNRKRAAVLAQVGRYEFDVRGFEAIEGKPLVYWWSAEDMDLYRAYPLLGKTFLVAAGVKTGDDTRFTRQWFEVTTTIAAPPHHDAPWQFYIKGAAGTQWIEPGTEVISYRDRALQLRLFAAYVAPGTVRLRDPSLYFRKGIAFSPIGATFSARAHRLQSIFGNMGSSVFPEQGLASTLCTMNSTRARQIVQSLNPGLHFENEDVERLPLFPIAQSDTIFATLDLAFAAHESARETSIEFRQPGPSPWTYAQLWAQRAGVRATGEPLPPYEPTYDPPAPTDFISFAIGVAMGRFGAAGQGLLAAAAATELPHGILFVSAASEDDSLAHPVCAPIHAAWTEHAAVIAPRDDLRTWLRTKLFADHKTRYENRLIYFPLSSEKKSFVAWISIHRWQHDTLHVLLANHLKREETRLEGQLEDLQRVRSEGARERDAERRYRDVQKLLDELQAFITSVRALAERGPPPSDDHCPPREVDARFAMDLDDGVMVNAAALWPLLDPQWRDPKKWWRELATAQGRKDYDWAHLAARYFPRRVDAKCHEDPSLAVPHRCFWRLHPAKAHAWELRLQDEIRPDFTIDEPGSDAARAAFLQDHPQEAEAAVRAEATRGARGGRPRAETDAQMEMEAPQQSDDEGDDTYTEEAADA